MRTVLKKTFTTLALCMAAFVQAPAYAAGTVVVELYTSQGCSSCPAADRVLGVLNQVPGVLPLSLNVDYWDYLGWKDDLALPGNAKRQRAYSRAMRSRNVYTPQMMLDGKMDVVGSRKNQVTAAINAYLREADSVELTLDSQTETDFTVTAPATALPKEAVVWVVGYDSAVTRKIGGGENSGRTITYHNVVRDWQNAGSWNGTAPLTVSAKRPKGDGGFVVILQQGGIGPILGAVRHQY